MIAYAVPTKSARKERNLPTFAPVDASKASGHTLSDWDAVRSTVDNELLWLRLERYRGVDIEYAAAPYRDRRALVIFGNDEELYVVFDEV